ISTVRAAWETQVQTALTVEGVLEANVSGWLDPQQQYPRIQLVEDPTDSVRTVFDFGGQYAVLRYIVVVEDSGREPLSAAKRMDEFVSWDHANSVFAAMNADRTLGGEIRDIDIDEAWS